MSKFTVNTDSATSKLFVGVLAPKTALESEISKLTSRLETEIGTIARIWEPEAGWIAPESYALEMGEDLTTAVFVFDGLWHPLNLGYAKHKTMKIENIFSKLGAGRKFNLNPGMIDKFSMRLASHKPSPRRYQISKNVWVEDQMQWVGNKLEPLPYAFQEYLMGKRYTLLRNLSEATLNPREIMRTPLIKTAAETTLYS